MKRTAILTGLLIAMLLSACGGNQPQAYVSEEGGFQIMTPLPLEESTQSVDSELGPIEVHFFMAELSNRAYMVGYSDYPEDFIAQSDPQVLLDGARDGAVGNINGKLVSEFKISLADQYPGRELVVTALLDEDTEGTLKGRMYLVNNRLYQIMVVAPSGDMSTQAMDDFINSFTLLQR